MIPLNGTTFLYNIQTNFLTLRFSSTIGEFFDVTLSQLIDDLSEFVPNTVIQMIQIGTIRQPCIFVNKRWKMLRTPLLGMLVSMWYSVILLQDSVVSKLTVSVS